MCHLKWSLTLSTLLHLFSHGLTSASNETETISTRKEVQHGEMNKYSIPQSDRSTEIYNMTLLDSHQTIPNDTIDLSVALTRPPEEKLHTPSLIQPHDRSKYSPVPSPNKTSTSINSQEDGNSTEGTSVPSSLSDFNDRKQLSFVYSSDVSELPLASEGMADFNITEPETSSNTSSSSESNAKTPSQTTRNVSYPMLPSSYEQSTVPSTSDPHIDTGVHNSTSHRDYIQKISNLDTEGTVNLQNMSVPRATDSYSSPHTSQVNETSDSSNKNASPFPGDAITADSQSGSGTYNTQSEGRQHSAVANTRSFQQLNNFRASNSEPQNGTDNLMIPNGNQHPSVSDSVDSPPPTSSFPKKNLKPLSDEGLQVISLPTYHPNDVIHVSSSEMYPSDGIRNASHEEKNPCARTCKEGSPSMVCRYKFELEWYYTMSKACYNCPLSLDDCDRKDCVVADGVKRPIVVVNRQMPGPSIEVCKGDRIIVDLQNHMMEESTSIHWHGHHQRGTPYMDGVPYVTQCPIPPKSSFRYHYIADTPGTHFWHSHSGCQRADGVFGALIIRVPSSSDPHRELYDKDLSEHIVQVLDWDDKLGVEKFLAHHHANGNNKPKTLLVNGRGRFHQFQDVNSVTRNVTRSPISTFTVQQGFRYRFRLINAGFLNCPIELSVDNHTLLVISSDGTDLRPVEAKTLVTYAGERFDFVLKANNKVGNYWMRFRGLMDCDERFTKAHQVAVLHYDGAPLNEEPPGEVRYEIPRREGLQVNSLNVGTATAGSLVIPELHAMAEDDQSLKEEPDMTFYLSYDFYELDNPHYHRSPFYGFHQVASRLQRLLTPQLNHISLKLPPFPLLSQHGDLGTRYPFCNETTVSGCESKYCECTHVIEVPLGAVLELILIDKGNAFDANHPFHLHGHAFRVIAMERLNRSTTVEEVKARDKAGLIHRKLKGAPIKDTITVPDGGFTIVRVHASNPGYWLFHCHIEFHVELGMAVVFKVGQHHEFPSSPKAFPRCNNYMPSEEEAEQTNDVENDIQAPNSFIPHWWPLRSSSASMISVPPDLALLLLLCAAVR